MTQTTTRIDYGERLDRVREHIRANLDKPLNLDELADIACLSRFHWHRVYRGLTGETVWQTVRRLRLHRAAADLANGNEPVDRIAERSGYANARAFSKAFRDDHGLPPIRYRVEGGHRRYDNPNWQEDLAMYDTRIETRPEMTIAGLTHKGSYMNVGATFEKLGMEMARHGGKPQSAGLAAVYFDDPDITPVPELRSLAGVVLAEGASAPEGFETCVLPAGRYAILVHKGPYGELSKAYSFLFGTWLKENGEIPRAVPALELYLNTPLDAAPKDLVTEVTVALEAA